MTTINDLEKIASNIVEGVIEHEGMINTIATLAGVALPMAYAEKALPLIKAALDFLQQEQGKSLSEAFQDLMSHMTPGLPNSPILAPTITTAAAADAAAASDPQSPKG